MYPKMVVFFSCFNTCYLFSKLYHKLICSDMFTISHKCHIIMQICVKGNESLNQDLFFQERLLLVLLKDCFYVFLVKISWRVMWIKTRTRNWTNFWPTHPGSQPYIWFKIQGWWWYLKTFLCVILLIRQTS